MLAPLQLTGLAAGSHTISVRGVEHLREHRRWDTRSFTIDSSLRPQAAAAGATQQRLRRQQTRRLDKTAPKVSVVARSSRVSKKGAVSFRVGCPKTETSCKVTVQLKRGSSTVARKTVTVKGGRR